MARSTPTSSTDTVDVISAADMSAGIPIVSPTGLTNAIRRDKSPRKERPVTPTFLAAQQFNTMPIPIRRSQSEEPRGTSIPHIMDSSTKGRPAILGCRAPSLRRPTSCTDVKGIVVKVKKNVKESTLSKGGPKCVHPSEEDVERVMKKAQAMAPDEEQVLGCFQETRKQSSRAAQCVNTIYDMLHQECRPGTANGGDCAAGGDDSLFFRYGSPLNWGSGKETTRDSLTSKPVLPGSPPRVVRESSSTDPFRSPKCMRFPEAANIENPAERSEREKDVKRGSPGRRDESDPRLDLASPIEELGTAMASKGEDQASLRAVRLEMFKFDDGQGTVSRARLSRALGELSFQDATIKSLQQSLENTKETLMGREEELDVAQKMCKSHERSIQKLLDKAAEESRTLEEKFQNEAQEKVLLQGKVAALQEAASLLQFELEAAKKGRKVQDGEASAPLEGDVESDNENVWTGVDSTREISLDGDDSSLVVRLRTEVVTIKSQIADEQAEHAQRSIKGSQGDSKMSMRENGNLLDDSDESQDSELVRLRSALENAEAELASLRKVESKQREAETHIALLEQKLGQTEDELENAFDQLRELADREQDLTEELEEAKKNIAELERELAASHRNSLEELAAIQARALNESMELEAVKSQALSELEYSREEVMELKVEVQNLNEKLMEANQETAALSIDRSMERQGLEEALQRSKDAEKELKDKIADLEDSLEKAEASSRQIVAWTDAESRSVKRKLDDSFTSDTECVTRESFHADEKESLKEQLFESQEAEKALRAEVEVMRELLEGAEELAESMEAQLKEENEKRRQFETRMISELYGLRTKLVASEEKALRAMTERAHDMESHDEHDEELRHLKAKQQSLLTQIQLLRHTLDRLEIDRQQEKLDIEEERRIHEDMDSKRMVEIERLREDLEKMRARADRCNALRAQVDDLRVRLATKEVLYAEMEKSTKLGKQKDEMSRSLRGEVSSIKTRIAAIRNKNASRRQNSPKKPSRGDSSTEKSTSSDSALASPRRRVVTEESPEQASRSSSPRRSPLVLSGGNSPISSPPRLNKQRTMEGSSQSHSLHRSRDSLSNDERAALQTAQRNGVDVSGLQKRLRESNQRLQEANIRLKVLAKSTDDMLDQQSKTEALSDDLISFVAQHSDTGVSGSPPRGSRGSADNFRQKLHIHVTENKSSAVHWGVVAGDEASI